MTNQIPEFTDKQLHRIDEVYNHVVELCTFLTDGQFDTSDLMTYGPLAEDIAESLVKAGYKVNFPTQITDDDHDEISDYFTI